jgi:hypothetical protein
MREKGGGEEGEEGEEKEEDEGRGGEVLTSTESAHRRQKWK